MEAVGIGLQALGSAIGAIAGWTRTVFIVGIAATAILLYTKTITIADLKELLKKDKWK